jgi:hypothetical protein
MAARTMKEELIQFVQQTAHEQGIPPELISAVVERVRAGKYAVDTVDEWAPLAGMVEASELIVISSLDDLEKEIDFAAKVLAKRVITRAVADHQRGVLERRCE